MMDAQGDACLYVIYRAEAQGRGGMHEDLISAPPRLCAKFMKKISADEEIDDWLIVNQALSSERDNARTAPMLQDAIEQSLGGC